MTNETKISRFFNWIETHPFVTRLVIFGITGAASYGYAAYKQRGRKNDALDALDALFQPEEVKEVMTFESWMWQFAKSYPYRFEDITKKCGNVGTNLKTICEHAGWITEQDPSAKDMWLFASSYPYRFEDMVDREIRSYVFDKKKEETDATE